MKSVSAGPARACYNFGPMPLPPPRFGIGEWYGHSFVQLTPEQRRSFSHIATHQTAQNAPPCPFRSAESRLPCTKKGGICSLRLYKSEGEGSATAVEGMEGELRAVCQHRFKQDGIIYSKVGEVVLGTPSPRVISEVRFLRRNYEPSTRSCPK